MDTFSIIVGDGLSRDILSRDYPHRNSRVNIGRREIERLMGKGRAYGTVPLPTFLGLALEARAAGAAIGIVLLNDATAEGEGTKPGHESATPVLVEPLEDLARDKVYEFCYMAVTNKIAGAAAGFTMRPVALR